MVAFASTLSCVCSFVLLFIWSKITLLTFFLIFREVLASSDILDMEERADWKNCTNTKEEETKLALKFREIFKSFDFTL